MVRFLKYYRVVTNKLYLLDVMIRQKRIVKLVHEKITPNDIEHNFECGSLMP